MEFVVAVDVEVVCLPLGLLDRFHLDSRLVWLLHRSRSRPVVQFRSPLIGLIPGKHSSGTAHVHVLALEMYLVITGIVPYIDLSTCEAPP